VSRYRKIDPRIWNDAKFRDLSDRGKLAFLFILTHPHMTSLGAMRGSLSGLATELGWSEKAFREAFGEALAKGMLEHGEKASFVGVPNFLRYNVYLSRDDRTTLNRAAMMAALMINVTA
jgi:hypothetical protein